MGEVTCSWVVKCMAVHPATQDMLSTDTWTRVLCSQSKWCGWTGVGGGGMGWPLLSFFTPFSVLGQAAIFLVATVCACKVALAVQTKGRESWACETLGRRRSGGLWNSLARTGGPGRQGPGQS